MTHIHLRQTTSTSTLLRQMLDEGKHFDSLSCITTDFQTGGRGQLGNSWESADGQNLLISVFYAPQNLSVASQFYISMAVCLALTDILSPMLANHSSALRIKWPNDIYVEDKKIAGILIENKLAGHSIAECIIGLGLNVNQQAFLSNAPNPISLANLTSKTFDIEKIRQSFLSSLVTRLHLVDTEQFDTLVADYRALLYRADGQLHPFRTEGGRQFSAQIANVAPDGRLTLTTADGQQLTFLFKEVEFVI